MHLAPRGVALLSLTLVGALAAPAFAQRAITSNLTRQDFTGYAGAGLAPIPAAGQVDSDELRVTGWTDGDSAFGSTNTTLDFARGADVDGGVSTGGLYGFSVGGDSFFGMQPGGGDFDPGDVTWRLVNNTGATIDALTLSYELWIRNDAGRSMPILVEISTDDEGTYNEIAALDAVTPAAADATPTFVAQTLSADLTSLGLANGDTLFVRWTFGPSTGTGSRDEMGLDDLTIRLPGCGNGLVEGAEACDDGNASPGDGCAANCTVESGFLCSGTAPTTCTDIDECAQASDNCDANATCDNTPGGFTCTCHGGFSGNGVTCTNLDECTAGSDNCDANATCADTIGAFTCTCIDGFTGDGVTCADIDECTAGSDNCDANATCTNVVASFQCACNSGFDGDGVTCADIDECSADPGCDANATCANMPGSFSCTCNDGFSGDGFTCTAGCGDGSVGDTEGCDDGNLDPGDGCAANCSIEDGYTCSGAPSVCTVVVDDDSDNDGIVNADDNCPDDANGNQLDSDGDGIGDACDTDQPAEGGGGGCGCHTSGGAGGVNLLLALGLVGLVGRRRRRGQSRNQGPRFAKAP